MGCVRSCGWRWRDSRTTRTRGRCWTRRARTSRPTVRSGCVPRSWRRRTATTTWWRRSWSAVRPSLIPPRPSAAPLSSLSHPPPSLPPSPSLPHPCLIPATPILPSPPPPPPLLPSLRRRPFAAPAPSLRRPSPPILYTDSVHSVLAEYINWYLRRWSLPVVLNVHQGCQSDLKFDSLGCSLLVCPIASLSATVRPAYVPDLSCSDCLASPLHRSLLHASNNSVPLI